MASPIRKVLRSSENVTKAPSPQKVASASINKKPPKAPRSAFMCFTDAKKKEIMSDHGIAKDNDDILKLVAREWRALTDRDRAQWDEEARNDKVRFVQEKAAYKGPWAVPKRRAKKHPLAPKRPMSAFLKYSQTRRATVKHDNPDMSNTDVSRLLGEMWRNASPKERAPYVEQEKRERAVYKDEIQKWRDDQARMDAASRTSHQSVQKLADYPPQLGFDRSYTASFENLHLDSFEEPPAQRSHRQAYSASYAPYRQPYPSAPEVPMHLGVEYHDPDPLPVSRPPLPPPQMDEEDLAGGHYTTNRSNYFADSSRSFGYYSRYP